MRVSIKYKGQTSQITLEEDASLADLQNCIADEVSLEVPYQKLILKGKILPGAHDASSPLSELGVKNDAVLTLLGTPQSEADSLKRTEDVWRRREHLKQQPTVKVRQTSQFATVNSTKTRFHSITPFPESPLCPHRDLRLKTLQKLASDPAILSIMEKHDFQVGDLTELHPHKDPNLLGLNKNAGQQICLRILTDRLDGIVSYNSIRRVLCHELAHNVHGPHGLEFKELDSQLAKEVVAFENDPARKGNRVGGDIVGRVFEPEVARELLDGRCDTSSGPPLALGHRLGQASGSIPSTSAMTPDQRRAQAAEAAQRRMQPPK